MRRWRVEKRSQLVAGAWCNLRPIDAPDWYTARVVYAEAEGLPDPMSPDIRASELSHLNAYP